MIVRAVALAALLVPIVGCDTGPSGPGTLQVVVTGESLSGVLVQIDGPGIGSFSALGDTRIYAADDPELSTRHRVVLITPGSGELRFSMEVADVEMEGLGVTVLQATRADNRLVSPSAASVRIVR